MRKSAIVIALFSALILFAGPSAPADAQTDNKQPPKQEVKQEAPAQPQPIVVTVKTGDTLDGIAKANNSTYKRMFDANTNIEHPDRIYPDENFRVPSPDEKLTERALPQDAVVPTPQPTAPVAVAPAPKKQVSVATPAVVGGSVWDSLAKCEAGGRWNANTGNGFYGGLQFTLSSWKGVGGSGYPSDASREEQIMRGQMLLARQGWGAWPACSAKLGLR